MRRFIQIGLAGCFAALLCSCALPSPRMASAGERPDLFVRPDPAIPVRAAVLAIHGINGSAETFAGAARSWAGHGIATRAIDVDFASASPRQVHAQLDLNRAMFPDAAQLVVAESLGASLAIIALAEPGAPPVDGLILLAPAIWPESVSAALLTGAFGLAHSLSGSETMRNWARTVALMDEAGSRASRLSIGRIIVLTGGHDEVVPDLGIWRLEANLGDTEFRKLPDNGHTLLAGFNHAMVEEQLSQWMLDAIEPDGMQFAGREVSAGSVMSAFRARPAGESPP
jgi:hypothetical protein